MHFTNQSLPQARSDHMWAIQPVLWLYDLFFTSLLAEPFPECFLVRKSEQKWTEFIISHHLSVSFLNCFFLEKMHVKISPLSLLTKKALPPDSFLLEYIDKKFMLLSERWCSVLKSLLSHRVLTAEIPDHILHSLENFLSLNVMNIINWGLPFQVASDSPVVRKGSGLFRCAQTYTWNPCHTWLVILCSRNTGGRKKKKANKKPHTKN